jgi:hypothetical protein
MATTGGRIQDICEQLSQEFFRMVPLNPVASSRAKNPSESALKASSELALQKFYETAKKERLRHRLGVIARARVAFGVQQRLLQAGYPSSLVKQVLFAMLTSAFIGDKQ